MPDTSPSPGRPAASRARAPSSNQGDPETYPAAPARPRQTKRSGKPGIARAERQGTRWRDIQWVEFGSEPEPAVPSPLPPEADAPAAASPEDDDGVEKMLRQFAPAAPESGRIDIPGLASRFARQAVPGPIALRAARERHAVPASAIAALARLRSGVGREPKLEAASSETGTAQPPDTPPAEHGERADADEHFPASILTPVGSAAEPQPAARSIAQNLGAQLSQAGAVLRRKRESVGNAVSTRLVRARAVLRPQRPAPSPPLPAAKVHPIIVPESPPEPAAPRIEPAAEAAGPPAPEPRSATPSRVSVLAARVQATALRLAGNDPERLRRWLTIAGAAIIIAVAAYAVGAMVAGLAGSDTKRHTGSEKPAPAVQAVTAQPQAKPPPRPQASTIPPNDPVERAAFYLARAKAGDPVAQYDIGVLYTLGSGLVQDYTSAVSWFHTAAAQGNIDAEYNLGVLYERGLGVTASSIDAVNWYRSAADQNHARAQYNLALAYAEGRGTEQDLAAAARWYQRAAQQGLAPAMINLAILYERGQGSRPLANRRLCLVQRRGRTRRRSRPGSRRRAVSPILRPGQGEGPGVGGDHRRVH